MTRQSLRRRSLLAALLVQSVVLTAASTVSAALVTWGAATNIAGDTDVSTTGSLVGAFNIGDTGVSSATVNGVLFQSMAVANGGVAAVSIGNFALSSPGNVFSDNAFFGSPNAPFSSLSASYQTLLGSGVTTSDAGVDLTLTISGLTVGAQYEFQWFSNYSAPGNDQHTGAGAPSGGIVTLNDNTTGSDGGLGQFAIGTFTADATSQVINFDGPVYALINGFQLRQVPAVPEPGTALAGLLAAGLCGFSRRRQKR